MLPVYSPVLDRPSPTLAELRARSTPAARRVLESADALGRYRIDASDRASSLLSEANAPPAPPPTQDVQVERALTPVDLLRSLLAWEPERLASLLPGGPSELFRQQVARWQALSKASHGGESPPLRPSWGRRWVLRERLSPAPALDVDALLGSIAEPNERLMHALCELDAGCQDGSRTAAAAEDDLYARLWEREITPFEPVPPAYLDRHGGLAALDSAIGAHPGAFIVGPPGSGRSVLYLSWAMRLAAGDGPPGLDAWHAEPRFLNGFYPGATARLRPGSSRSIVRAGLGDSDVEALIERWHESPRDAPAASFLVVIATAQNLPELRARLRDGERFAEIHVPPLEEAHRAALWLCHQADEPAVGLEQVLGALYHFRESPRLREAAPWDLWALLQPFGYWPTPPRPLDYEPPRLLRRLMQGKRVAPGWVEHNQAFFDRFLPGELLADLQELEARLHGKPTPASPWPPAQCAS